MTHRRDVDAMTPALELTIDYVVPSLQCAGTLDSRTGRHVIEAVEELLAAERPSRMTIDISELRVDDVNGANVLLRVQRTVEGAGVALRWQGLGSDHLSGILPLGCLARRSPAKRSTRAAPRVAKATHPAALPPLA